MEDLFCEDCPCFEALNAPTAEYGECRKSPRSYHMGDFPVMAKTDWCYEGRRIMKFEALHEQTKDNLNKCVKMDTCVEV